MSMRVSTFGTELVFDGDTTIGVSFGHDFCSEHETGIGRIRQSFGSSIPLSYNRGPSVSPFEHWKILNRDQDLKFFGLGRLLPDIKLPPMGVERRRVGKIPPGFGWHQKGDLGGFGYDDHHYINGGRHRVAGVSIHKVDELIETGLSRREKATLVAAWDSSSFLVIGMTPEVTNQLRDLYERMRDGDMLIAFNHGLQLLVASRLPKEDAEVFLKEDMQSFEDAKWLESTGIHDFLLKAGRRWYSLSSVSRAQNGERRVWLNPMEQGNYNAGWYTIDQLKLWAENKGPVMKTMKKRGKR